MKPVKFAEDGTPLYGLVLGAEPEQEPEEPNIHNLFGSGEARVNGSTEFNISIATGLEQIAMRNYHIDPWLPKDTVIGVYGRGEAGKSTWVSTMCALASASASTLWVSSEEAQAEISTRYYNSGAAPASLVAVEYQPTIKGTEQTVTFDVYQHLEPLIEQAKALQGLAAPVGIVVLDAIVTLVEFEAGGNANSDKSVKALIAHLLTLADKYKVTIIILGHLNKNSTGKFREDMVTGSAAWTNSVRYAYAIHKDREAESDYESIIELVKANTGTRFAARFQTVPVHTLHTREDGVDEVLCKAEYVTEPVWGSDAIETMVYDNATDKPKRVDKATKHAEIKQAFTDLAVDAIRKGGATTRDEIMAYAEQLHKEGSRKLHPRDFVGYLDTALQLNCGITITTVEHGKLKYS